MITRNTQQYLRGFYFTFSFSFIVFLLGLRKLSCKKKYHANNLYCISYTLSICYVMYYIVLEVYIGGYFLEECLLLLPTNYPVVAK